MSFENQGNQSFLAAYPRIFAGISRGCPKSSREKKVNVQFSAPGHESKLLRKIVDFDLFLRRRGKEGKGREGREEGRKGGMKGGMKGQRGKRRDLMGSNRGGNWGKRGEGGGEILGKRGGHTGETRGEIRVKEG